MWCKASLAVVAALGLACCTETDRAVPRPRAFHRIDVPGERYDTVMAGDFRIVHNSAARMLLKAPQSSSQWFDVDYPGMGATVYCSVTPVTEATVGAVIANREERMALNSGGNASELIEFANPRGISCRILLTRAGTATPVQFVAVAPRAVISGSAAVNVSAGFRPDSIAPVVEALRRDVTVMLENL